MTRQQVANTMLLRDTARANLLTNGGFEIWQRGTPINATVGGAFGPDRWLGTVLSSSTATMTRAATIAGADPAGQYYASYAYTHGASGTGYFSQVVENYQAMGGRTLTFSMFV